MIKKEPEYISVIDLSAWESDVRYERLYLDFVPAGIIAKASEYKWRDKTAKMHMDGAARVGAKRGLYHFYRPHDLDRQLTTYFDVAQEAGGYVGNKWTLELPPILDVEYSPNPKNKNDPRGSALVYEIKYLLDGMEKLSGHKPVIYTSENSWSYLFDALGRAPKWCADYPLWIAAYPNEPDKYNKPYSQVSGWGDNWAMWQYSEAGRMPNFAPYDGIDLNIANPEWWRTLPDNHVESPTETPTTAESLERVIIYTSSGREIILRGK